MSILNVYYSKVKIEPKEAFEEIVNKIDSIETNDMKSITEAFYTEDEIMDMVGGEVTFSEEEGISELWLLEKVGCKWFKISLSEDLKIESSNYIPVSFLVKIYNLCKENFESVSIKCKWLDQNENHVGYLLIKEDYIALDSDVSFFNSNSFEMIENLWTVLSNKCENAIKSGDLNFKIEKISKLNE